MSNCDILIVGAQGAGLSAASEIRRFDSSVKIVILEKSNYISFSNCGIPLFIRDKIKKIEELTYYNREGFEKRKNVKIVCGVRVYKINNHKREVFYTFSDGREGKITYSKLILAVGATPNSIGENFNRVFSIRGPESAISLKRFLSEKKPEKCAIVGGGAVGLEMADALSDMGISVEIFEKGVLLPLLTEDARNNFVGAVKGKGIKINEGVDVNDVEELEDRVLLKVGGDVFEYDFVIYNIGIYPSTNDIEIIPEVDRFSNGAILVNEFMQSSLGNIYACGDCIAIRDLSGKYHFHPSGQLANITGRVAGRNVLGIYFPFGDSLISTKLKISGYEIGWFGDLKESSSVIKIPVKLFSLPRYVGNVDNRVYADIYFDVERKKIVGGVFFGKYGAFHQMDLLSMMIYSEKGIRDFFGFENGYTPFFNNSQNIFQQLFLKLEKYL